MNDQPTHNAATTLVVASHSAPGRSVANRELLDAIRGLDRVTIRPLEELYPGGRIDVGAEQAATENAERIVFQFCMNWYSTPGLPLPPPDPREIDSFAARYRELLTRKPATP